MKKGGQKRKGGAFEREIAKMLSMWWSNGKQDDIFWLTSGSGARATNRRRTAGLATYGQSGDITATHPSGMVLTDNVHIELKRGYNKDTPYDIVDKPNATAQEYEKWFDQIFEDMSTDGTKWFWLITRRDKRKPIIHIPSGFLHILIPHTGNREFMDSSAISIVDKWEYTDEGSVYILSTQLDSFLNWVDPELLKSVLGCKND